MGRYDDGFLTDADRAYLRGETDPDKDESRDVRYRIRERLKGALRDLGLVENSLPDEDRARVFNDLYQEKSGAAIAALSLLYLSAGDRFGAPGEAPNALETFERVVEAGIQLAERKRGYLATVEANIDVGRRQPDHGAVRKRVEEGEATVEEFLYLGRLDQFALLAGAVESDDLLTFQERKRDDSVEEIEIRSEEASELLDEAFKRQWRR